MKKHIFCLKLSFIFIFCRITLLNPAKIQFPFELFLFEKHFVCPRAVILSHRFPKQPAVYPYKLLQTPKRRTIQCSKFQLDCGQEGKRRARLPLHTVGTAHHAQPGTANQCLRQENDAIPYAGCLLNFRTANTAIRPF